ncbi:phage terminase large subunit [Dyella silvatica]|uniref:phage terminase large subunit n=1 Tax=Dyella silvatica TaxID=2992128 RepID=UPI00224D2A02|nr:phage terminase large subunit [Dyella silvatica]
MTERDHPFLDFRNFVFHIWKHLNLPSPTPVQYDISVYLQHGPRRRVIEAFRGIGKSWLTAAYVCWLLWKDPQHKILVVSASKDRADAFSIFVKRLIETVPELAHLKPRGDQRNSNLAFDVGPALPDQSPSVKSVGITGQLTGSRADTIIADDVEVVKNSATVTQREKLSELIKEFDAILKPLASAEIIYLGTPQTEESIYNLLPARGYEIRVWPARYPKDHKHYSQYAGRLAPFIAEAFESGKGRPWSPVEPTRFHEDDLLKREASYGRSGFMLQFMLDTTLSDAERYPLKLSDLVVMDIDREVSPIRITWSSGHEYVVQDIPSVGFTGDRLYRPMYVSKDFEEYTGTVMSIDPSGRGGDETGYAVTKLLRGMVFLRRAGGIKGGYSDDALEQIAHIARAEKVKTILVESNFGDGMFVKLLEPVLRRIYPCGIEETRSTGQKERRIIDTLEPVMNQHRLVVDASLLRADQKDDPAYQLFHQLTRITRDRGALRHDDRLDALAMSVAYWTEYLSRDVTQEEDRRMEELFDEELRRFEETVFGFSAPPPNYYDNY